MARACADGYAALAVAGGLPSWPPGLPPAPRSLPPANTLALQASAQAAFSELVAQAGAAASLDRPSRRAFAKALSKAVVDMRGAVYVR